MKNKEKTKPPQHRHPICIAFESEEHYSQCVQDTKKYREYTELIFKAFPESFPEGFEKGFTFHDQYTSKKMDVTLRRIRIKTSDDVFLVRPSFVMPYMIERTDFVEKALYLRRWGVSYGGLTYVFGKDPMFWYRADMSLGRPSIVSTTIKSKENLPKDLGADEKHTRIKREKCYVTTTVSGPCILGASVVPSASADDLKKGYGDFAKECQEIDPSYAPETVCVDGWDGTWKAWKSLFPFVTLILCFLHSALKVTTCFFKDKNTKKEAADQVWNAYRAETKAQFSQRIRRLREWSEKYIAKGKLLESIQKLCSKCHLFTKAYDFKTPYRTSNVVDRLMNYQDRLLYSMQYFHGTIESARKSVRSMAMLWNFHPYVKRMFSKKSSRISPFHDVNGFVYHENWLHNFLVSSCTFRRKK